MQGRLVERSKGKGTKLCVAVRIERKQTAMHYQSVKKKAFLKIVLATPTMVTQARGQPTLLHILLSSTPFITPSSPNCCLRNMPNLRSAICCPTFSSCHIHLIVDKLAATDADVMGNVIIIGPMLLQVSWNRAFTLSPSTCHDHLQRLRAMYSLPCAS